jgi:hypothetical protein
LFIGTSFGQSIFVLVILSGRRQVYGNDPKSLGDKAIAQMRSKKSGSTRNDSNLFRRTRFEHGISEKLN